MKKLIKNICVILVIILLVQTMSPAIFALSELSIYEIGKHKAASKGESIEDSDPISQIDLEETDNVNQIISEKENETEIIGEIIELRTENSKHFRHKDGSFSVASYPEPVHYEDINGKWQEIDNTLAISKQKFGSSTIATYKPKASSVDVSFPQNFKNNQKITVNNKGYTLSIGIQDSNNEFVTKSKIVDEEQNKQTTNAIINNDIAVQRFNSSNKNNKNESGQIVDSNNDKMILKKKESSIKYENTFDDADLEYVVTPSKIKENIIIKSVQTEYIYEFEVDYKGLVPRKQENGSIDFVEKNTSNVVFTMESPYMYDAKGDINRNIDLEIENNLLKVIADSEWINDSKRSFPVIIDPTIVSSQSLATDVFVNSLLNNTPVDGDSCIGYNSLFISRAYIKPVMPKLPAGSVITDSELVLYQQNGNEYNSNCKLCVFEIDNSCSNWNGESITWNNQPLSKEVNGPMLDDVNIVDYLPVEETPNYQYRFNITTAIKNCYENSYNKGFMIGMSDETRRCTIDLYSSESIYTSYLPSVVIDYVVNSGIEDYWSYETQKVGEFGQAAVNVFNGAFTYSSQLLDMNGERLPISLSLVHNNCLDYKIKYNSAIYGMHHKPRVHLNVQKMIKSITSGELYDNGYRYMYYDSDGTVHYFINIGTEASPKIVNEFDSTMEIITDSTYVILSDVQGNKEYYKNMRLVKIEDRNGNIQTFTYDGVRLTSITDGAQRTVSITYDTNRNISSITDPSGRVINFTYTDGLLTQITYPGGNETNFYYNDDGLCKIVAEDLTSLEIKYCQTLDSNLRVNELKKLNQEHDVIESRTFLYTYADQTGRSTGNTKVIDQNSDYYQYSFDKYGRISLITNQYEQSVYSSYGEETDSQVNRNKFNNIMVNTDLLSASNNLLLDGNFETNPGWTLLQDDENATCAYVSEEASSSVKSLKMSLTDATKAIEADRAFEAVGSGVYTASVDIKIIDELIANSDGGVVYGFTYKIGNTWYTQRSEWITSTNNSWKRFDFTAQIEPGTVSECHVFLELAGVTGTVYFDNVQIEASGGPGLYNYIQNSGLSFTKTNLNDSTVLTADCWIKSNLDSSDGIVTINGENRYRITGDVNSKRKIQQMVRIKAQEGDTIILGGKAIAFATKNGVNREFCITAVIFKAEGGTETIKANFDPSVSMIPQTKVLSYTLPYDCSQVLFSMEYNYQPNEVYFTDAFLYLTKSGDEYTYTDEGLIETIVDDENKTVSYEYDELNRVSSINQTISDVEQTVATLTYDNNNNVTSVTNQTGEVINYSYNDYGKVESEEIIDSSDNKTELTIEYTQDGNYIKSVVNEMGGVTTYSYDNGEHPLKGLVTRVEDPNGNITTFNYEPDTDKLVSISGNAEPSVVSSVSFSYENQLPKTITRNGTVYTYEYDDNGCISSSKVGTQVLSANTYDDRQRISQVSYANGNNYVPVYDSRGRLSGEKWNGSQISKYYYNDNGKLSKFVDEVTGVNYRYDYALYNLPFKIVGSDDTKTECDYDRAGTISRLTFSKGKDIIYSGRYYPNEKGMPQDVFVDTLDNAVLHYNYDSFGRVCSSSCGPIIQNYTYLEKNLKTTGNVSEYVVTDFDENELVDYIYSYDDNNNITSITDALTDNSVGYTYDGLNRLTKETVMGVEREYTYNENSNITSMKLDEEPIHTFTYGNDNWKDQLTAFDGKTITYDANGNPLTYDGYSYTWQRGTQLATITGNGKNISYVYDSQGNRVQKTVNGVTTDYIYSGSLLMRQTDGTNTLDFQYDASGDMVGFIYNGTPYYYLRNLLNDISGIVDSNGNIVAKYRYDAYGNIIYSSGDMAAINPIRYRGYYYDTETNWYYLQSRYYNPEWCRFISPDCLFIAGDALTGSNMYAYCNDNPVFYVDKSGTEAEENEYEKTTKIVGHTIRLVSRYLSRRTFKYTTPAILAADIIVLPVAKAYFGENFAESELMQEKVVPSLNKGATGILPLIPGDGTFDVPTGLRHFMPVNMAFGAPWGGYFLGFEVTKYGKGLYKYTNYTTVEGKYMWQSQVGYSWLYDYFFSLGGPIERYIFKFEQGNVNYVIWCWKGDYWNLGAGAEIGLYYTESDEHADNNFYLIDENLTVHTRMIVKYRWLFGYEPAATTIADFHQTNWWVTVFSPIIQYPNVDLIDVELYVRFTGNNYLRLMEGFLDAYVEKQWSEVTFLPWAQKDKPLNHELHDRCNLNPAYCSCVCPNGNIRCAEPCSYYTNRCLAADAESGCQHYNDADNGFQFKITLSELKEEET